MDNQGIKADLEVKVRELAEPIKGEVKTLSGVIVLKIKGEDVLRVLKGAMDFPGVPCDILHDLTVLDCGDRFEVVYQLLNEEFSLWLRIKAMINRENPVIDSATSLWPGADWPEREAYDMFGVIFRGHPKLKRIYMWDDFEGYPLRKDYVTESLEQRSILRIQREGE